MFRTETICFRLRSGEGLEGFVRKFRVEDKNDGYITIRTSVRELKDFYDSLGKFIEENASENI